MTALREAFSTFRRAPLLSVLGIVTIAFSLFAFGLFGLVAVNIRHALHLVEERVEVRAFVIDGTTPDAITAAMRDISAFPEVAAVHHVTPQDALVRARQELPEFSDVFEEDVLPASIEIRMAEGFRDPKNVEIVAQRVGSYDFVDDVRFGEDWIIKLYRLRNVATFVGLGLGLAFACVAAIIIASTIRILVLARAKEISIMRLVGATDGFIRTPFLVEGFIQGILGGLLALGLTWITSLAINPLLQTVFFSPLLALLGVLGGALLGFLASAFAVSRHLRQI